MISNVLLIMFPVLMAYAASSDLLTMRIANWLVGLVALSYFILAFAAGIPLIDIAWSVAAALLVLAVAFTFFAFGWIGGGDAKLAAATTLWVSFGLMLPYLVYASLLGGLLTFAIIAIRRYPLPAWLARHSWIDRLHDRKSGVPYGITLALAALLVYEQTPIFQHFAG